MEFSSSERMFPETVGRARAKVMLRLAALSLLAGCSLGGSRGVPSATPSGVGPTVPGLYLASTPCAHRHSDVMIALLPGNLYQLTVTDRDSACEPVLSLVYLGRWLLSPNGRVLTLIGAPDPLVKIVVVDHLTLRLEAVPQRIEDGERFPDFRVAARGDLVPLQDPLWIRGLRARDTVWKVVW